MCLAYKLCSFSESFRSSLTKHARLVRMVSSLSLTLGPLALNGLRNELRKTRILGAEPLWPYLRRVHRMLPQYTGQSMIIFSGPVQWVTYISPVIAFSYF